MARRQPSTQRQTTPTLREVVQQIGQRLGTLPGLPSADRLDTVDAVVRAVADAPVSGTGTASRGLILLGLPELAERGLSEDSELRQLYMLGARIALAYRGRVLLLVSPQPSCFQTLPYSSGPGRIRVVSFSSHAQLLDLMWWRTRFPSSAPMNECAPSWNRCSTCCYIDGRLAVSAEWSGAARV